ncbi:MAG TPA: 4-hydroxy-tetrahydrodipicolinate reductase [Steroidobacteraceae bacterium]|nr:4-hydroxy-tetrahydrodipicolinate reductase [Steroidobacteraceae bacterium]
MADAPAVRAALVGATGRTGRAIAALAASGGEIEIVSAVASPGSEHRGRDLGELIAQQRTGIVIGDDLDAALDAAQVVLDFSHPVRTESLVRACRAARRPLLIGTTGLPASLYAALASASRDIALLVAPNTSIGVTVLLELVRQAAHALPGEFDVEIGEAHHRYKRDAPSGTALAFGDAVARARGGTLQGQRAPPRDGARERQAGEIGFAVVRGGDIVGEHDVRFIGTGEEVSLAHRATDRAIFARGAIRAAIWLAGQPPGRYQMGDVLGFAKLS